MKPVGIGGAKMDEECFVDEEMEPDPRLNRITNAVIGAAIEVHRTLGPGHLESVYEEAMAIEMELRGICFQRQLDVELLYKGRRAGKGRLDFLVEGAVVLELKAVEQLTSLFNAKMISYLSITGHPLGLIINFNVPALRHGIKRIAGRPRRRDPTTPL
jgi:GxxExxY protein